ncbi:MAG: hypothetical protein JNK67_15455 [Alphaproteobacteria bacterium]|nr:hypothetical protein [Alphaproteobacteria bacterium]
MITPAEIAAGLYGAWRLAQFKADGLRWIDGSLAGARRSFWVALIALPGAIPLMILRFSIYTPRVDELQTVLVETIAYAIGWTAFPVVGHIASRVADRQHHFTRLVAAYNWASLLQIGVLVVVAPISHGPILPDGLGQLLGLVVQAAMLAYLAFVIRIALDVPWGAAIGLALVEFFLGQSVFHTVVTLEDGWPLPPGAV